MARMSPDGTTPERAYLEASARKGNAESARLLEEPERPDAVAYLYDWFLVLRRGSGMNGPAQVTHTEIESASRLRGWDVSPFEVEVLCALDDAVLTIDVPVPVEPTETPKVERPWPTKKKAG